METFSTFWKLYASWSGETPAARDSSRKRTGSSACSAIYALTRAASSSDLSVRFRMGLPSRTHTTGEAKKRSSQALGFLRSHELLDVPLRGTPAPLSPALSIGA